MENVNCPQIVKQVNRRSKIIRQCCVAVQNKCYWNQFSHSFIIEYMKWLSSLVFKTFFNTEPFGWLEKEQNMPFVTWIQFPAWLCCVFFFSFCTLWFQSQWSQMQGWVNESSGLSSYTKVFSWVQDIPLCFMENIKGTSIKFRE